MPRYSVNQATSKSWSLEQDAFSYSSLDFCGAGLWRHKVSDFGDEKTRALLDECGLETSSLSCVGGFTGSDGRWSDCVIDAIEALTSAHAVGAKNLLLHTGGRNRHIRTQAMRCLHAAIEHLLPFAEEFGVRLLLQPMLESVSKRWNFLHDWASLFEVIDRYPSHLVGFVLNTYHCSFLNEISPMLPKRIDQLGLVQVADSMHLPRVNKQRDDCLLGEGALMPDHWLRQAVNAGYDGWVEVESVSPTLAAQGYEHVLKCSNEFVNEFKMSVSADHHSKIATS